MQLTNPMFLFCFVSFAGCGDIAAGQIAIFPLSVQVSLGPDHQVRDLRSVYLLGQMMGAGEQSLLPVARPAGRRRAAAAGGAAPCGAARCSQASAGGAAPRAPHPAPGAPPWSSWLWL